MNQSADQITKTSAHLSLVEMTVGSILHGLKIPFGGHFLSLIQGFYLLRHTQNFIFENSKNELSIFKSPIEISAISATLKSLSIAGNKIGPMVSIFIQGILFSIGLLIGNASLFGQFIGLILLSLWAFIQPFITLYFIHGTQLNNLIHFYFVKIQKDYPQINNSIWIFVISLIFLKITLCFLMLFVTLKIKTIQLEKFENLIIEKALKLKINEVEKLPTSTFKKVLHDLTRPLFLFSIILLFVFLMSTETKMDKIILSTLRPVAIAFLFFYILRSNKTLKFLTNISTKNKLLNNFISRAKLTHFYIENISKKIN